MKSKYLSFPDQMKTMPIAFELHKKAHHHFMDLGYSLECFTGNFTFEDRPGMEEAIVSAYLNYTDFDSSSL